MRRIEGGLLPSPAQQLMVDTGHVALFPRPDDWGGNSEVWWEDLFSVRLGIYLIVVRAFVELVKFGLRNSKVLFAEFRRMVTWTYGEVSRHFHMSTGVCHARPT